LLISDKKFYLRQPPRW